MNPSTSPAEMTIGTRFRAAMELMRPANIVTAFADILAGVTIAVGSLIAVDVPIVEILWLLLSTFGLYGGGVVLNDFFDAELDAKERPERPIPSGRISRFAAGLFGFVLLLIGIAASFVVNGTAGFLAVAIAFCAAFYDAKAKHSALWGPLFMGSCRGGNLLLGVSILPAVIPDVWFLALIPLIYIASITLVSQGEVHGGNKTYGFTALGFILLIVVTFVLLPMLVISFSLVMAFPFLLVFGVLVIPPFYKAASNPEPSVIKTAIKRGVLSLVILNSVFAAGFGGFWSGLLVVVLFFISIGIAKLFQVT